MEIKWTHAIANVHCKVIEDEALEQIKTICNHYAMDWCNIEIMPDAHSWKGCVIWFTATIGDKIIPSLVWVDIGCWMAYAKFEYNWEIDFDWLDKFIRENIPCWFNIREEKYWLKSNETFQFTSLRDINYSIINNLICKKVDIDRAEKSIWTLWWWNHFIEIDKDDEWCYYLVVHSWSRYLWKQICEYYQDLASKKYSKDIMIEWKTLQEWIEYLKKKWEQKNIQECVEMFKKASNYVLEDLGNNKDLTYLEWEDKFKYIHDADICKGYAQLNREVMVTQILNYLWVSPDWLTIKHTIHNYIDKKDMVIRKWAIKNDEECLIPINMRDWAFIVSRKENMIWKWNDSLPHWAGRLMSRNKAKETINIDDYKKSMEWIYSTCITEWTLDESPMAYKNINDIKDIIEEVCVIKKHIKPIYNFKAE